MMMVMMMLVMTTETQEMMNEMMMMMMSLNFNYLMAHEVKFPVSRYDFVKIKNHKQLICTV